MSFKRTAQERAQDTVCQRCGLRLLWWRGATWKHASGGGGEKSLRKHEPLPVSRKLYDEMFLLSAGEKAMLAERSKGRRKKC